MSQNDDQSLRPIADRFAHINNPAALAAAVRGDDTNSIVAQTPGGVEMQEAAAQRAFTHDDRLPIKGLSQVKPGLERIGFVFGEPLTGQDSIFIQCKLPPGWTKKATDHSMWSDLLDEKGRKRASIFFKGAFYDYDAHISFICRYGVRAMYCDENGVKVGALEATHKLLRIEDQSTEPPTIVAQDVPLANPQWDKDREEARKRETALETAGIALEAQLKDQYPEYRDPLAYWDDALQGVVVNA
jgi:hypothetical protein